MLLHGHYLLLLTLFVIPVTLVVDGMKMPHSNGYSDEHLLDMHGSESENMIPGLIQAPVKQDLKHYKFKRMKPVGSQRMSHTINSNSIGMGPGNGYEHEYGYDKGQKDGFKKDSGHKKGEIVKKGRGYKSHEKGNHILKEDSGGHSSGGSKYAGRHHKEGSFGKKHSGAQGSEGHQIGKNGHHNKGSKSKGFANEYHKEESGMIKKYFEDADRKKYHKKYNHLDSFFESLKGGFKRGRSHKGKNSHDSLNKNGYHKKGSTQGKNSIHSNKHGKDDHASHKSSHLKKIGSKNDYGDKDYHHGAHSNQLLKITGPKVGKLEEIIAEPSTNDFTAIINGLSWNEKQFEPGTVIPSLNRGVYDATSQSSLKIPNEALPVSASGGEWLDSRVKKRALLRNRKKRNRGIIEAVVLKNGKKMEYFGSDNNILNDHLLDSEVIKYLENLPDRQDSSQELKDILDATTTTTTTTTTASPDIEIVIRKKSPHAKGYSYMKKSNIPLYTNCTEDSENGCTTFSEQSRTSFTMEYSDDDDYGNEDDYPETREYNIDLSEEIDAEKTTIKFEDIIPTTLPTQQLELKYTKAAITQLAEPESTKVSTKELGKLRTTKEATPDIVSQVAFHSKRVNSARSIRFPKPTTQRIRISQRKSHPHNATTVTRSKSRKKVRKNVMADLNNSTFPVDKRISMSLVSSPFILSTNRKRRKQHGKNKVIKITKMKLVPTVPILDTSPFVIPTKIRYKTVYNRRRRKILSI